VRGNEMNAPLKARHLIAILLSVALLAVLTACGTSEPTSPDGTQPVGEASVASSTDPGATVNLHGHWVVSVEDPDGQIASSSEFDNAFVGANTLSTLLTGAATVGSWSIILSGTADACTGSAGVTCLITEADVEGNTAAAYDSFDLAVSTTGDSIVLSGSATVNATTSLTSVGSSLASCGNTVAPNACTTDGSVPTANVTATSITPIAVSPGQVVRVAFTLTLADAVAPVASTGLIVPDAVNDLAYMEIPGVLLGHVVVVSGPGFEVERILGFDGTGAISETPGVNAEKPFVFEFKDEDGASEFDTVARVQDEIDRQSTMTAKQICDTTSMSLVVYDSLPRRSSTTTAGPASIEGARFNLYGYGIVKTELGSNGRTRFTLEHQCVANNALAVQLDDSGGSEAIRGSSETSRDPATDDQRVEIAGVGSGASYPAVAVDTENRTITLTYDWQEAAGIFEWAESAAKNGAQFNRTSISIIEVDGSSTATPLPETSRTNYFDAFPISFDVVDGFGTSTRQEHRIIVTYGSKQAG
jgi:hypothetical protein